MSPTIKYHDHHSGSTPEQRIASRLRNSGSPEANTVVQKGSGPGRTFTNIHDAGTAKQHNTPLVGSNRPFKGQDEQ
jgi:hypothetical protein